MLLFLSPYIRFFYQCTIMQIMDIKIIFYLSFQCLFLDLSAFLCRKMFLGHSIEDCFISMLSATSYQLSLRSSSIIEATPTLLLHPNLVLLILSLFLSKEHTRLSLVCELTLQLAHLNDRSLQSIPDTCMLCHQGILAQYYF